MQQQPGLFQGQQTGFAPQLQSQPSFQAQQTGYNLGFQQQPQQQQQPAPQLGVTATGYASGFGASQQPLQQQKTGFSSALALVSQNKELKIPSMRLSFITAADQAKFENLFRTAVPVGENAISGDAARDILLRSGLSAVTLAEIWALSDTNKLGLLLFPEFALALSLCNAALKGDAVPQTLPDKWYNEVQSFVDAISFAVPEDPAKVLENTPFLNLGQLQPSDDLLSSVMAPPMTSFTAQPTGGFLQPQPSLLQQRTGGGTLIPLQPQQTAGLVPAASGLLQSQRTGPLPAQGTGFNFQTLLAAQRTGTLPPTTFTAQPTGGFQPQPPTSFQAQPTGGFQPQTPRLESAQSSYFPPQQQQSLQQQLTGYQQPGIIQAQRTGNAYAPLQAQPTGRPGEWGFVSMPTGGLPGLNAMLQHFMPSSQLSSNNLQNQMGGSLKDNVGWAITKQEKQIYDGIFGAWDTLRKGYIDGDVAISIFGKSGLARPDLESVWNLCDASNRGKLNKDEFAVAMHLVYRRLNGLELPLRLPPELVPPSAKLLQDSVDSLKNSLKGGSASKKNPNNNPTVASRFKNDDDDISYVSSSRYKSRRPHDESKSSLPNSNSNDLAIQDLKKLIREKQILLDAVNLEDQHEAILRRQTDEADAREIENLKYRIKDVQQQLAKLVSADSEHEKAELLSTLENYTKNTVPLLILRITKVNTEITDAKIKLCELQLKKQYTTWSPEASEESIVGTGPNGQVTDADRRRFKSKQLMKQRMAALTGKAIGGGDSEANDQWKMQVQNIKRESEAQASMVQDVLASIQELEDGTLVPLQVSIKAETGSQKWELGEGVSESVRLFVTELNAFAKLYAQPVPQQTVQPPQQAISPQNGAGSSPAPSYLSVEEKPTFANADEKSAYVKATAGKRMQERLAKLKALRSRSSSNFEKTEEPIPTEQRGLSTAEVPIASVAQLPAEVKPIEVKPVVAQPEKDNSAEVKPMVQQSPQPVEMAGEDEELEDEEYAALLKQKLELEKKKKERDLKRSREKEARLEKLKKEMEALKANDKDDDGWSDDDLKALNSSVSLNNPHASNIEVKPVEKKEEAAKPKLADVDAVPQVNGSTHKNNPFAKPGTTGASGAALPAGGDNVGTPTEKNTNPFFRPTNTGSSNVDTKKLENQRAAQRGLGLSDWSDDEEKSSDDDAPNRAGAAKLASLLFGGMPQPVSRTSTGLSTSSNQTGSQIATQTQASQEPVAVQPSANNQPQVVQEAVIPPVPSAIPPIPAGISPVPISDTVSNPVAPPIQSQEPESGDEYATPPPSMAHEPALNNNVAIPPPLPSQIPPPPPPLPTEAPPIPSGLPPPPPPPPAGGMSQPSAGAPSGGMPNLGALLGQIQGGKSLKKVSDSEKHVSDSATVGRVL